MIPQLDARRLAARDPRALRALARAVSEVGFLTVTDTGIDAARISAVIAAYRAFFTLPEAQKRSVDMAVTGASRGWGAPRGEQVDPTANPDYKEVFDMGFEAPETGLSVYAENRWPDLPGFRTEVERYYRDAMAVAMELLRAIAEVSGRERTAFDAAFDRPMALLRANYYPPRPDWAGDKDFGIAPHTDYGCLTLLGSDGVAGLEVMGRDGAWRPVAAAPGTFVINFGEMLETWTEGAVRATLHRVRGTQEARISVPLFFNPNHDTNVAPPGAAPVLAGDHLARRYGETYLHLKDRSPA